MPQTARRLTDARIRNASPREKSYKLYDAAGLYVEVSPAGGKLWRWKYRFADKEKRLALGRYPAVALAEARKRRDEAERVLSGGEDPGALRRAEKEAQRAGAEAQRIKEVNRFESVAREWYAVQSGAWVPSHGERIFRRLERDVFPYIGAHPIAELGAPEVLGVLRRIEARGARETAHRALSNISQVFRYAVATGRADADPTRDLRGALEPVRAAHHAALTDPDRVGAMLRALADYRGTPIVRAALRLAPLVFVRPGELRRARWEEMDLEHGRWSFTVSKTRQEHIVPLAQQAVDILRELEPVTGGGEWVFPGARSRSRPMSENAVLYALRGLGVTAEDMTGHGFRALARTLLDEALGFPPHLIEHQLAHRVKDPLGRAYNRTAHLPERAAMMQRWADYLDELRTGERPRVVPIRKARRS
jgi:integrase